MKIGIIGCSRVGCSFAKALSSKSDKIKVILCKVTNTPISLSNIQRSLNTANQIQVTNKIKDVISNCDIIFIAVKDDKIVTIVEEIIRQGGNMTGKYFLHFSGSLTCELFSPLKVHYRVKVGSLHPVASFPSIQVGVERMFNIWWVFEGDGECLKKIGFLIKLLNGKIIKIDKSAKILHHIVCVFSANFLVGLLFLAKELARENSSLKEYGVYLPLVESVIKNAQNAKNIEDILTGPVVRGDINTITRHLSFLEKYPTFLRYYKMFSSLLLDMSKEVLDKDVYAKIKKMLK
ncbi:MAG: Rossmann-like and DUF2520 domain-containing protein [Planctomycetota bacterium]